ncbi:MAG: P1 family peptidase, partial [Candidatus Methylomirabilales bacterium]
MARLLGLGGDRVQGITAVPGIRVGHFTDLTGVTGCTVLLPEGRAVGGVDVRGSASGTRELDALSPGHLVQEVHGILLAGGSAYGLEAAAGVMRYLEEIGIGFPVGVTVVPIVPAAILFDLTVGDARARPDAAAGYAACQAASAGAVEEGSVGAGTGATVGKLFGMAHAVKGGVGTASRSLAGGVVVGALAVVNAFGDVRDPRSGRILAGARDPAEPRRFADTAAQMQAGRVKRAFGVAANTTLAVVATNATFTKVQVTKVAQMGHLGLARVIQPVHTTLDGDVVFALATGGVEADLNTVGMVGADCLAEAILRGILAARGLGGVPSAREIAGEASPWI